MLGMMITTHHLALSRGLGLMGLSVTALGQVNSWTHSTDHRKYCSVGLCKSTSYRCQEAVYTKQKIKMSTRHSSGGDFRLFEGKAHTESYALFRPTYPPQVFQAILDYCRKTPNFSCKLAIDIACGTGQSTEPLTAYFERVRGMDRSPRQIEQAQKHSSSAEYVVGRAEDLSDVNPGSVDLLTCAQSFHWFDHSKVYAETRRVLKPGGVFAVYGYGNVKLSLESASEVVQKFFSATLGKYWPPERVLVTTRYAGRRLELGDFSRVDDLEIRQQMPLASFIGYVCSWSAYQLLLKDDPASSVLQDLKRAIIDEYKRAGMTTEEDGSFQVDVSWPIYILLGRNL